MTNKTEDIKSNISNVFSTVSDLYDSGRNKFFSDFGKLIVEEMNLDSNSKVLDIATGRGAILFPAYNELGEKGKLVGIDLSEGMIEKTSIDINNKNFNIDLYKMDAEKLEFEDNSFDYIFCGFALFFFPNLNDALSEIYRILKPNGKFGASTFYMGPDFNGEEWFVELCKEHLPTPVKPSKQKNDSNSEPKPIFYSEEGMRDIFEKAGFNDINIIKKANDYYYTEDEWWNDLSSQYFRRHLDNFTPQKLEQFKAAVYEKLNQIKVENRIQKKVIALLTYGQKV